jgi:hypothetical protein
MNIISYKLEDFVRNPNSFWRQIMAKRQFPLKAGKGLKKGAKAIKHAPRRKIK